MSGYVLPLAIGPAMRRLISVVTPCFNEELNVHACYEAVRRVFADELPEYEYEHIFADNASTDRTADELRRLAQQDSHVKAILNSRNFGVMASNFNALLSASGDAVIASLPADLQDPPEVIPAMVRAWERGCKVVYGIRAHREESLLLRNLRRAFYRVVNRFSETPIPVDAGEFQLVDRVVVQALRRFEDYYPYIRGLIASCGYRSEGIAYTWRVRKRGASKANWYRLFDLALNAFVSFSNVPIRLSLVFGLLISAGSIFYAFTQLILALLLPKGTPGVPTIIIAIFFFGGVQLFFIGILGEYLSAVHSQVRKRPLVIEAERLNYPSDAANATPGQLSGLNSPS